MFQSSKNMTIGNGRHLSNKIVMLWIYEVMYRCRLCRTGSNVPRLDRLQMITINPCRSPIIMCYFLNSLNLQDVSKFVKNSSAYQSYDNYGVKTDPLYLYFKHETHYYYDLLGSEIKTPLNSTCFYFNFHKS